MGGYIIMIVALLISAWALMTPGREDPAITTTSTVRPTLQAIAANIIEHHRAMVDFVKHPANRYPTNNYWWWETGYPDETSCGYGYYEIFATGGVCLGGSTDTDLNFPTHIKSEMSIYSVFVCDSPSLSWGPCGNPSLGQPSTVDILVTGSRGLTQSGYTPTQVLEAVLQFPVNNDNWFVGICQADGTTITNLDGDTMITSFCQIDGVAIATIIP